MFHIKRIIAKIKNAVSWIPIIYNDDDYDYESIYKLLHHKLSKMYEKNSDEIMGLSADDKKRIYFCIRCINRMTNVSYYDDLHSELTKKWGKLKLERNGDFVSIKYENETDENKEELKKDFSNYFSMVSNSLARDKRLLFKVLGLYIDEWWV